MKQYTDLIEKILSEGEMKENRTGIKTKSIFGHLMKFDLSKGFPLLTLKKTHFKIAAVELLWMLSGSTDVKYLHENGVTIWDEWILNDGTIGKGYGYQWRNFFGVDQIANLVYDLKNNPNSRRLIVSAWNPAQLNEMSLPPCHTFFQCYVSKDGLLSLQLTQRSADTFLGVPYNIAFYALLIHILAAECDLKVGNLLISLGDAHIYENHIHQCHKMLSRSEFLLPELKVKKAKDIFSYSFDNFELVNYQCHPVIKADVAI